MNADGRRFRSFWRIAFIAIVAVSAAANLAHALDFVPTELSERSVTRFCELWPGEPTLVEYYIAHGFASRAGLKLPPDETVRVYSFSLAFNR